MMITRNFIGVLALCLCALAACTSSKESKKTLTVLSWNVWHGGHSKTYSGKGCEGTIDILKKSEADVVLMIETYGAAPMVADSLGYSYNLISDNLSIYSRYWKSHSTLTLLATQNYPFLLKYDCPLWLK